MKITVAWADVLKENGALKLAVIALTAAVLLVGGVALRLASSPPLIIERTCYSRAVIPASTEHTAAEIEAFMEEAVRQRFDSGLGGSVPLLSPVEATVRRGEQKELDIRRMAQHVLVGTVKATGDTVEIEADRLISVGPVRSAFPFPLTAKIASTKRSEANPYGLELLSIAQTKKEGAK